ncbi:MAG: RNA-binding cell elongation regulator Jag/EloR [Bacillota bacterium]|nr:RNA-binding cell elongation regulator Jag/EloR [Bacillota bacterium]
MREEWTGETVEEAVARALHELGLPPERVEITVLEAPSEGLFGRGRKAAVVRVRPRPTFQEAAQQFMEGIVSYMAPEAEVHPPVPTERGWMLSVAGDGKGVLIGRRGKTLQALQYLVEMYAFHRSGEKEHVVVDVNDYRHRRREWVRKEALKAARMALRTGKPQRLEPMTAYERYVVHTTVQEVGGVRSASEGREPQRRVVIYPEGGGEGDDQPSRR